MKLPCTVIEDMLPIYVDGICSDESEVLVNEHLAQCPQCSAMLAKMREAVDLPKENADDLKPLKQIEKRWKKSKRQSMRKGICLALAAIVTTVSVLAGIWYFSYAKCYFQMAQRMERTTEEDIDMASADYKKEMDGYRFGIWMPILLSNDGFVRVTNENGVVMFIYPELGGGYSFKVSLHEDSHTFHMVWLNPDLTPDYEGHPVPVRPEWERAKLDRLLTEQRQQIIEMCRAVRTLWGIELLDREWLEPC